MGRESGARVGKVRFLCIYIYIYIHIYTYVSIYIHIYMYIHAVAYCKSSLGYLRSKYLGTYID